jgi:ABC transporter substrate binding protein
MRRREFIKIVCGSAIGALPLASFAQQGAMPVVGFINAASAENFKRQVAAFLDGLAQNGYIDGEKVKVEYRWAEGRYDQMPAMIAELLGRQVAVISVTGSTAAVQAAMAATRTIPIVFVIGGDPVKFGLVASLNRPGGNVTGVTFLGNLLVAKQLGLLHELIPGATNFGFLTNPNNPNAESDTNNAHVAADALGRKIIVVKARTREDIDDAFIPAASATPVQALRLAEWSQPQPRSMASPEMFWVRPRPPRRDVASSSSVARPLSARRRAAPIPAAPPPTIITSTSVLIYGRLTMPKVPKLSAEPQAIAAPVIPSK